jgi:GAF domain-containing protein
MYWLDLDYSPDSYAVREAELLVATADHADHQIEISVSEVLKLLRDKMNMDVVFVSEFMNSQRVLRHVEQAPGVDLMHVGQVDALEDSWCQRVVDKRLPGMIRDGSVLQATGQAPATAFPIGTYISTPVVLQAQEIYGTLCCFSFGVHEDIIEDDLMQLRDIAALVAQKINRSRQKHATATSLMNDFIMTHLRAEAMQILFTIDGLDRLELLLAALPSYESKIIRMGLPARLHMDELRQILGVS